MKLAEALIQRADLQKRMQLVQSRVLANLQVQQGDEPAEDPNELLAHYAELNESLRVLVSKINRTNAQTELEGVNDSSQKPLSIADALALREKHAREQNILNTAATSGTIGRARLTRTEVKFVPTVDVAALRKRANEAAKAHRELDTKIQQANWTVDLIE